MKQCPFCKAEIEEHARFCLYCMTSLDEKQVISTHLSKPKWRLLAASAVLLCVVCVVVTVWLRNRGESSVPANTTTTTDTQNNSAAIEGTPSSTDENDDPLIPSKSDGLSVVTTAPSTSANGTVQTTTATSNTHASTTTRTSKNQTVSAGKSTTKTTRFTENPQTAASKSGTTKAATTHVTQSNKTTTTVRATEGENTTTTIKPTTQATQSTTTTTTTTAPIINTAPSSASMPVTTAAPTKTDAVYLYRTAVQGDDFNLSYVPPDNAVVITGVARPSSDGVYNIPATIDGKKVVGIMNNAFGDEAIRDTVNIVVIPDTVRTVWDAFTASNHLTDVYLRGNVYISHDAFPSVSHRNGTLTIHSSADCTDRNFRKYSTAAASYHALWQEWDGVL